MKSVTFLILFILSTTAWSQDASIIWQRSLGGTAGDNLGCIKQTNDGGYIAAGNTSSNDGDVTNNHGALDIWVVKLSAFGIIEWQHTYGGSLDDYANSIVQTTDGGYFVGGTTKSNDGDVTGFHGGTGPDSWVLKLDSLGNIQWNIALGSYSYDYCDAVIQTQDGNYLMVGKSSENTGDVTGNHGLDDYWIVKLDASGNYMWQKSYGGSNLDMAHAVAELADGSLVVCGSTGSSDGNISINHGKSDIWLIKMDDAGNLLWENTYGGTEGETAYSLFATTDGGFILAGDADSSIASGMYNYCIVKVDNAGGLQWNKQFGGSDWDFGKSIIETTGGYIVTGSSSSSDGDVTDAHGATDAWILKLDTLGNIKWKNAIGGSSGDLLNDVSPTNDGGFIFSGGSNSTDGDLTLNNHGSGDAWVVKYSEANVVTGICFHDYNQNNIQDIGEPAFFNVIVNTAGNGFSAASIPDNDGRFLNIADSGAIQTSLQNLSYYTSQPVTHNSNFASYLNTDTVDFAFIAIPGIRDLSASLIPLTAARPGFNVTYRVVCLNDGTQAENNVDVTLIKDSMLNFISANPACSSMNGDTLIWNQTNLLPGLGFTVDINFSVPNPPIVNFNDVLHSVVQVQPVASDSLPSNNLGVLNQTVTGAVDPNDKTLTNGDWITLAQVANADDLTYVIRFQNTGTDTAFTIVINDTLDNKLDWNTFEMISSSHAYSTSISNQRNIKWTFHNILLPDSNTNEPLSHGYICYKIKPLTTLTAGDVISNTAYIFFDFNPPVVTNTVLTSIVTQAGISETDANPGIVIYPNPVTQNLNIRLEQLHPSNIEISIYNLMGEKIESLHKENSNKGFQEFSFSMTKYPAGIYSMKVVSGTQTLIKKIIKL